MNTENKTPTEIVNWITSTFNVKIEKIQEKEIVRALIHPSYSNEHYMKYVNSNQRLEFLGDAIVDFMIASYLFNKYKNHDEGFLTTARAELVSKKALSIYANEIDLGHFLLLGKGEIMTNGRIKDSNLADGFESIIAAIYNQIGFDAVLFVFNTKIFPIIEDHFEEIREKNTDYKTKLQEYSQLSNQELEYRIDKITGPDHEREFTISVVVNNQVLGTGIGKKKKYAQNQAAKAAIRKLV